MKKFLFIFLVLVCGGLHAQFKSSKPVAEIEKNFHIRSEARALSDYKSDTTINVNYYKLELAVQNSPDLIIGKVTINSVPFLFPISSLFYDLSSALTIDSITSFSGSISYSHSNDKINITLPRVFNLNELISTVIYYHGVPDPSGFGSFEFGSHTGTNAIWTLSEPFGSSDWFPCKNVPSDKADSSDIWITCADNFTAVSNGLLKEVVPGIGTKTYKWHNSYPIANYLISIAITNYSQYDGWFKYSSADSMPVNHFIYPENLTRIKPLLDKTIDMLKFYSNTYGLYPFVKEKYGHAEFGQLGGMEHQTCSSMGYWSEDIIAHELTHQWFGDKITCKDWHHIWLNESFATYGEALYEEYARGKIAYDGFMLHEMNNAKNAVGSIYVQNVESVSAIFDAARSYSKGGTVLHMLRNVIGDSLYFASIKEYVSDTTLAYKSAVTEDFQRNVQQVSGQSLNYFFSEWIYGENYPKYSVSMSASDAGNRLYNVSVKIEQAINTNPAFFTMPVDIKFFLFDSDTTFTVFNNAQTQTFNFLLKEKPAAFKIDPNKKILCKITGDEPITPVSFELSQNYPNPFNPSTTITYQVLRSSDIKLKIYNTLGQEIRSYFFANQKDGRYKILFDAFGLASGTYFYTLTAADTKSGELLFSESKSMQLIK
ncbi:MAG: T9SS type A sorting domain-containing protein [Ignavibacteria bacterium]|nr:T9SS type A sorting domain-containing protein [Ignavibacteria bacterium]